MNKIYTILFALAVIYFGYMMFFQAPAQQSISDLCVEQNGIWIEEYQECEGISQDWCDTNNGKFECTSEHLMPVLRDGKKIIIQAKDIKETDLLFSK